MPTKYAYRDLTVIATVDERLTGAALDRLTHRCVIVETTGESYRLHDAKRRRSEPNS